MMDKYIDRFPEQLREALEIGEKIAPISYPKPFNNIIISGMGGSGIGAGFVKEFIQLTNPFPLEIINNYQLPVYAADNTLLICCSYSGNTEETLSVFRQGIEKKCNIICISTGGKLKLEADQYNFPVVLIPGAMPPRTCLGYSIVAQLYVLLRCAVIENDFVIQIKRAITLLKESAEEIKTIALISAEKIKNTIPIIYTAFPMQHVGIRLKQQINENAKMHCFFNVIPEMNHNELLAYYHKNNSVSALYLRDTAETDQIKNRFDLCSALIKPKVAVMEEFFSKGTTHFEKVFYLIHLGDWLSFYLAELHQVDPVKIQMLDWLKTELEN